MLRSGLVSFRVRDAISRKRRTRNSKTSDALHNSEHRGRGISSRGKEVKPKRG